MKLKGLDMISTAQIGRDEWLKLRRSSIGGSDASAIAGLSEYVSPYSVYADKLGPLPEVEDNEAMRQGRDLEDYVARRWCEATGKKMSRCNYLLKNPVYPWAHANIDRQVIGEDAGLECKTTTVLNTKVFKTGEFPVKYYAQCLHYLAVTGADRWYLAVLVLGREFHTYVLERDQAEIDTLMAMEEEFWHHVQDRVPPDPDGMNSTTEAIRAVYADSDGGRIELFGRDDELAELETMQGKIKDLESQCQAIKNIIMNDMGSNEAAFTKDWRITWKPNKKGDRVLRITKTKKEE